MFCKQIVGTSALKKHGIYFLFHSAIHLLTTPPVKLCFLAGVEFISVMSLSVGKHTATMNEHPLLNIAPT